MKRLMTIFCALFVLVNMDLNAQEGNDSTDVLTRDNVVQFRLRIGEAFPRNSFGDRLGVNNDAALAENGLNIGVGAYIPIYDNIDFAIDLSTSSYGVDDRRILANIRPIAPDFSWESQVGEYDVRNVMGGPRFYIGKTFRAYVNPTFGISWIRFPSIRVDGQRVEDDESITTAYSVQNTELSRNFAIAFHTGFEYFITEQLAINLNFEWMQYEVETTATVDFIDVDGGRGIEEGDVMIDYSTYNLALGVVFKLNR